MSISAKYPSKERRKGVTQEGNDRGKPLFPGCKASATLQGQICTWMAQTLIANGNAAYAVRRDLGCSKSGTQSLESCSSSFYSASQELDSVTNRLPSNIMCLNFKKRRAFEFSVARYANMLPDGAQMFPGLSHTHSAQLHGLILSLFYSLGQQFHYTKPVQPELMVENPYSFLLN